MQLLALSFLVAGLAQGTPDGARSLWTDLDGDGRTDVLLFGGEREDVALFAEEQGGFVDRTALAGLSGGRSRAVLLADLDGDGRPDLVRLGVDGVVRVQRGEGSGAFGSPGTAGLEGAGGLASLEVRDLDRDGAPDLVGRTQDGDLVTMRNLGALLFDVTRVPTASHRAAGPTRVLSNVGGLDGEATPGEAPAAGIRPAADGPPLPASPTRDSGSRRSTSRSPLSASSPPTAGGASGAAPLTSGASVAQAVADQAVPGAKLLASSVPMLGRLFPLSSAFYIDALGNVGIGTTTIPSDVALQVEGKTVFGTMNTAIGGSAAVGGGKLNDADASFSVVAGGTKNTASATYATVAGGVANTASGLYAAIPGGNANVASGKASFAVGQIAQATHDGSVVFADTNGGVPTGFGSTGPDQFLVRATGGVGLGTDTPLAPLHVTDQSVSVTSAGANYLETILAEDANAVLGLYSDSGGNYGSGIVLGEIVGGALANKWALVRRTTTNADLEFTFGDFSAYNVNPTLFTFGDEGDLRVGSNSAAELTLAPGQILQESATLNLQGDVDLNLTALSDLNTASQFTTWIKAGSDLLLDAQTNVRVQSGGNDAIYVDSAGRVGVKTLAPIFDLHVNGTAGKPGGGSWAVASDARLKENVAELDGALEKLMRLRGVTFEYIDPESIGELPGTQTGMIAQEVAEVFPEWVEEAPDGYLRLSIRGFEALTVEALRDLREEKDAELDALRGEYEARIEALEARLAELDRRTARF